jgi:hypothetical protein
MRSESPIQREIRLTIGQLPDVVVWRNNVGTAVYGNDRPCKQCGHVERKVRRVKYGLQVGSSDLIGVLRPSGRLLAVEVKTATGRASEEQKLFLELVRDCGGAATMSRSPEEALEFVERVRRGESK